MSGVEALCVSPRRAHYSSLAKGVTVTVVVTFPRCPSRTPPIALESHESHEDSEHGLDHVLKCLGSHRASEVPS